MFSFVHCCSGGTSVRLYAKLVQSITVGFSLSGLIVGKALGTARARWLECVAVSYKFFQGSTTRLTRTEKAKAVRDLATKRIAGYV